LPPECLGGVTKWCFASDWWAVGAVAYQVCHEYFNYLFDFRKKSDYRKKGNFEIENIKNRIKKTHPWIQPFIEKFLTPDPKERATFNREQQMALSQFLNSESSLLSKFLKRNNDIKYLL